MSESATPLATHCYTTREMIRYENIPSPETEAAGLRGASELASRATAALSGPGAKTGPARVVRITVRTDEVSPLEWLGSQPEEVGYPRAYWSGRESTRSLSRESATIGVADFAADMEALLIDGTGQEQVRYYGGLRFDPLSEREGMWNAFGDGGFVMPRVEFVSEGGVATLSCNLVLPRDAEAVEEISSYIKSLVPAGDASSGGKRMPSLVSRTDSPDYEGWRENVDRVTRGFEEEPGKVVFARRADLGFDGELDALGLLEALKEKTPGCFHFYFEPEEGAAFIGATPERLYGREGRAIRSEAVAGTRPRGSSSRDDEGLREELLGSEKDRAEQRYVRDSIEEDLRQLCAALTVEEGVSEMKLASRRHLVSRFRGTLRAGVTDAEIMEKLHPTPAVGGYPKGDAIEEIRASEAFDRGLYAGPVGWVSGGAAEFAVGIRSGLVRGRELSLFSGAGVVKGSTPEGEWAEIEQKISDFIDILCAGDVALAERAAG